MPKLATIAEFLGAISFISGTEVKPGLWAGGVGALCEGLDDVANNACTG
jgi:hypothetical protein